MRTLLLLNMLIMHFSCNNFKNYGNLVKIDPSDTKVDTSGIDGKYLSLDFFRDELNIRGNNIAIRLDTTPIYFGKWLNSKTLVKVPKELIGKSVNMNAFVISSDTNAYYFESKDPLVIANSDNMLRVFFSKNKDFSERFKIESIKLTP